MRTTDALEARFLDLLEQYTYESLASCMEAVGSSETDSIDAILANTKDNIKKSIAEWLTESDDETTELEESVIANTCAPIDYVIDDIVDSIVQEAEKNDEESELDEASMVKHKISKIQSIIDKRKRETDPKLKASRKRTLMKIDARGGRVVNKKLSKAMKKSYKQGYGARWESEEFFDKVHAGIDSVLYESDCSDADEKKPVEGNDVEPEAGKKKLAKKLAKEAKIQKEAIKESAKMTLSASGVFGTLNESESSELVESFVEVLSENLDKATEAITESLLESTEQYVTDIVIPEISGKVDRYISEEVLPELEKNVSDYLEYVTEEIATDLKDSGKIIKSRDSQQLESFRDKLLKLIESDLQIIPEQQDAMVVLENKCETLTKFLKEGQVERIKLQNKLDELENQIWLEHNLPSGLSEATSEKLKDRLNVLEYDSHSDFILKATKVIKEALANTTIKRGSVVEEQGTTKQKSDTDIVSRTLSLLNK